MKVLVTGGAGFIGSSIAQAFLRAGHDVVVYDNLETGRLDRLPRDIEFVEGDIRDPERLSKVCQAIDVVIHQAAMVSVPLSFEQPHKCRDVNITGTQNVLKAARDRGVSRVVLASSAAVYGNDPRLPQREDAVPAPASPYAYAKWQNEVDAGYFHRYLGMGAVCLRYFNVFGPGQDPSSPYSGVISLALEQLSTRGSFRLNGDGLQTRDFIYVDDVSRAVLAAATTTAPLDPVINVGSGQSCTLLELLGTLAKLLDIEPALAHGPERPGDVKHSCADTGRLEALLDPASTVPLAEGLRHTLRWMRSLRPSLTPDAKE